MCSLLHTTLLLPELLYAYDSAEAGHSDHTTSLPGAEQAQLVKSAAGCTPPAFLCFWPFVAKISSLTGTKQSHSHERLIAQTMPVIVQWSSFIASAVKAFRTTAASYSSLDFLNSHELAHSRLLQQAFARCTRQD